MFDLAAGFRLRPTKVHREDAYELTGAHVADFQTLAGMELISERIDSKLRFFVPTDRDKGVPVVEKLLKQWPVVNEATGEQLHALRLPEQVAAGCTASRYRARVSGE